MMKRFLLIALAALLLVGVTSAEGLKLEKIGDLIGKSEATYLYLWEDPSASFLYVHYSGTKYRAWGDAHTRLQKRDVTWLRESTEKALATLEKTPLDRVVAKTTRDPSDSVIIKVSPGGNWIRWKLQAFGAGDFYVDLSRQNAQRAIGMLKVAESQMADTFIP